MGKKRKSVVDLENWRKEEKKRGKYQREGKRWGPRPGTGWGDKVQKMTRSEE